MRREEIIASAFRRLLRFRDDVFRNPCKEFRKGRNIM